MITLALFLGMVVLVAIDVPIALSLGIVALAASWWAQGSDSLLSAAVTLFTGATSFPLLAIPLFVLAGAIMNTSGISRRLIAFASALVGFVRGGLAMVNILASMFFAEISGSAVADVAALGTVIMPAMQRRGYPRPFTAAVTSSAASLAVIIPPSIPMILYAVMADTSVVKLFVAGIVPGILGGLLMMSLAYGFAVRRGYPVEEAFRLRRVWTTFKEAFWAFLLPIIILGGIFGGFVTATEGAALAVAAALLVGGIIYRDLTLADIWHALKDGAVQTAVVMLLIATSALLGQYLTEQRIPQLLSQSLIELHPQHLSRPGAVQPLLLHPGLFPARRRGHHPGRADRHADRARLGHRPHPFRAHRDAQHRHRPADAAGGQRARHLLLDRQGRHLGGQPGQCVVRGGAASRPAARDLRPARLARARPSLLRLGGLSSVWPAASFARIWSPASSGS